MKFRWLQTILAILVGTGWAMAQNPTQTGSVPTPGTPNIISTVPAADCHGECVDNSAACLPDDGHPLYSVYGYGQVLFWNFRDPNLSTQVNNVPVGFATVTAAGAVTTAVPITIQAAPQIPGASEIDTSNHMGSRVGGGFWFGSSQQWGVELSGFGLEEKTQAFRLNNSTSPQTLGISAVILPPATPAATTVVFPRQSVVVTNGQLSSTLWGMEANLLRKGWYYGPLLLSYISGVKYQEFEEEGILNNSVTLSLPGGVADPTVAAFPNPLVFTTTDRISARNQFYGVQIGAEADLAIGAFFFNAKGKVAIGDVRQQINVLGSTTFTGTTPPLQGGGGLLSGPADQGQFQRDRVALWPEINLKAGYQLGNAVRIYVGYDALYMQHAVRPGNQTDLAQLNTTISVAGTTQTVNVLQPVVRMKDMDVWVQGLSAGLEFRY